MRQFFTDDNGNLSMMRLKTLLLILAGIFIAIHETLACKAVDDVLILELIGLGLGFKVWQKMIETRKDAQ